MHNEIKPTAKPSKVKVAPFPRHPNLNNPQASRAEGKGKSEQARGAKGNVKSAERREVQRLDTNPPGVGQYAQNQPTKGKTMKISADNAFIIGQNATDIFTREVDGFWQDDSLNALSGYALQQIGQKNQPGLLNKLTKEVMGQALNADGLTDQTALFDLDNYTAGRRAARLPSAVASAKRECEKFEKEVVAALEQHPEEFEKGVREEGYEMLLEMDWLTDEHYDEATADEAKAKALAGQD